MQIQSKVSSQPVTLRFKFITTGKVNLRIQLQYKAKHNRFHAGRSADGKEQWINASSYHPSHPFLKHTYRQTKEFVYGLCALYIGRTKLISKLVIIISAA